MLLSNACAQPAKLLGAYRALSCWPIQISRWQCPGNFQCYVTKSSVTDLEPRLVNPEMTTADLNSSRSIRHRLLELLPSHVLKEVAGNDIGSKEEAVGGIAAKMSAGYIENLFLEHMSRCKQHVALFNIDPNIPTTKMPPLSDIDSQYRLVRRRSDKVSQDNCYFLQVKQSFVSYSERRVIELDFLLPIRVTLGANLLGVHFVILERATSLLQHKDFQLRHKLTSEKKLANSIIGMISREQSVDITPLDINKGVKYVWEQGLVDSPRTQSKGSKSTSIETMDHGLYLKADYSTRYTEIVRRPLLKTIFHFKREQERFGSKFICEPSFGRLSFTSYSNPGWIDNVVLLILQHN